MILNLTGGSNDPGDPVNGQTVALTVTGPTIYRGQFVTVSDGSASAWAAGRPGGIALQSGADGGTINVKVP